MQFVSETIGEDDVACIFEFLQGMDDLAILERLPIDRWLVNNNLDTGSLNAFDNVEHGVLPEVVGPGLHDETIRADNLRLHVDDLLRDEVLAGGIGVHDRADEVPRPRSSPAVASNLWEGNNHRSRS